MQVTRIIDLDFTIINSGKLSKVYKIQGQGNQIYTIKQTNKMMAQKYGRKKQILKQLQVFENIKEKPYFVNVKRIVKDPIYVSIVMDYYQHNLRKFLDNNWHILKNNNRKRIKIFLHIIYAKVQLNLTHRDLKLQNFMVNLKQDQDFQTLMTDFGDIKDIVGLTNSYVGTDFYRAPQVKQQENSYYDDKIDSWGLGTILYILFYNQFPFGQTNIGIQQYENRIRSQDYGIATSQKVPGFINNLIRNTVVVNQENRYSLLQILEYIFMNRDDFFKNYQDQLDIQGVEQFQQYFWLFKKNNKKRQKQRKEYDENIFFVKEYFNKVLSPLFKIRNNQYMNDTLGQFIYGGIKKIKRKIDWFKQRCQLNQNCMKNIIRQQDQYQIQINRIKISFRILRYQGTDNFKQKQSNKYFQNIIKNQQKKKIILDTLKNIFNTSQYDNIQQFLYL